MVVSKIEGRYVLAPVGIMHFRQWLSREVKRPEPYETYASSGWEEWLNKEIPADRYAISTDNKAILIKTFVKPESKQWDGATTYDCSREDYGKHHKYDATRMSKKFFEDYHKWLISQTPPHQLKEEAVSFLIWVEDNKYFSVGTDLFIKDIEEKGITSSDLYDLFTTQNQ